MSENTKTKPPIAKAHITFIRQTARKVRRTANLVRTLTAGEALVQLKFQPFKSVEPLVKIIESAMANAKHNLNVENPEQLKISQLLVDDGTMYKRWRAMNKGKAYSIMKRTSKISVALSEMSPSEYAKYVWDNSPRNKKNQSQKKAEAN
jgi:large subunit ribosomal protein L22